MSDFLAAVDCGTTAVKAAVFDSSGNLKAMIRRHVACTHQSDGRVEQDAQALQRAAFSTLRSAIKQADIPASHIACLCITNQRATFLWTDTKGTPLGPAIGWQDMRGERAMRKLCADLGAKRFTHLTGLPESATFSVSKILPKMRPPHLTRGTRILLLQDYLLRAFGLDDFVCDRSNASLTGMLDIHSGDWSQELLAATGLQSDQLSRLIPSGTLAGSVSQSAARRSGLRQGTPLVSGAGDQQCAGIGTGAVAPGIGAITLGTAGVIMAACKRPVAPFDGLMCTIHGIPDTWCIEGLQPCALDSIHWILETHGMNSGVDDAMQRELSNVAPGSDGALFWPYLTGSGAPHWNARARAAWAGLTHRHKLTTMIHAAMEGIAFENEAILQAMRKHGIDFRQLHINGGGSTIQPWNRMQSSVYGLPVQTLKNPQATLLGAAILGAVGVGVASSIAKACKEMIAVEQTYMPEPKRRAVYERLFSHHQQAGRAIRKLT